MAAASSLQKGCKEKFKSNFVRGRLLLKERKNKLNLPNRSLMEFSKKKLPSLDTQHILTVIENFVFQLEVVTLLPYIIDNLDRFSVIFGETLNNSLMEYSRLKILYNKLSSKTDKSTLENQTSNKSPELSSSYVIDDIILRFSDVVKTILSLFRSNPSAAAIIKNNQSECSIEAKNFITNIVSLRDHLYIRLETTVSEEIEQKKIALNSIVRGNQCQSMIHKLEVEFDAAKLLKEDLLKQKNDKIDELKLQIQAVEDESDVLKSAISSEAQKIHSLHVKESNSKQSKLQEDISQVKQQLQSNLKAHRENELFLRKRKYKMETEVENWIQKFDSDMTDRQEEYDKLSLEYAEEKKQLQDLEERFQILKMQYDSIMTQRRLVEEHRIAVENQLNTMVKAAILIQALWKGYRCRKLLKAKKKKMKKKKKKGSKNK